jgi:3',5'-cyclic-AMP phosphodiesterase
MPVLVDRRSFLKGTAALTAGFSLARLGQSVTSPLRLAILSDTHIAADAQDEFRGFHPHENLRKVVAQVGASKFDLGIINGDLARREGLREDYAQFTSLVGPLAEAQPLAITLGNHDDRRNARNELAKRAGDTAAVEQKYVSTLDAGEFKFIFLDSLMVTNISAGQLGYSQREWLGQYLRALGPKPVIVFVHHNPDPESDSALVDADRLLAILKAQRAVKALVFGHTHVYSHDVQDGLQLLNLPAVGYNFADGHPVGWIEASLTTAGGEFKLHALAGETKDNGKVTSLAWRST